MHRPATGTLDLIAIGTPANGRSSPGSIRVGGLERALGVHLHEGVDALVQVLDARERGGDHLAGRDLPTPHECGELLDRLEHQVGGAHVGGGSLREFDRARDVFACQ